MHRGYANVLVSGTENVMGVGRPGHVKDGDIHVRACQDLPWCIVKPWAECPVGLMRSGCPETSRETGSTCVGSPPCPVRIYLRQWGAGAAHAAGVGLWKDHGTPDV